MNDIEENCDGPDELESGLLYVFHGNQATSKDEINQLVIDYHIMTRRSFKVQRSDKRSLSFCCKTGNNCDFKLTFNYSDLKNPSIAQRHTCTSTPSKTYKVDYICNLPILKEYINTEKRMATSAGLDAVLQSNGMKLGYNSRFRIIKKLKKNMFGDEIEQYSLVESYLSLLARLYNPTALY